MAVDSAWDVKIVNAATLATVAFVPNYIAVQVTDVINDVGGGSLEMDFDDPVLADFYTNNSSKYPWEGNFAVLVSRNGTAIATFLIEDADIQYSGNQRLVVMQGRGLAACLEWAVVLPENWDENLDPSDQNVANVSRGFGKSHDTAAELDTGASPRYSIDSPKHKAYGGAAFTFLFKEADNGVNQTWTNYALGSADRNGDAVDWPLSLSAGDGSHDGLLSGWSGSAGTGTTQTLTMANSKDSNGTTWTTTATYPADEVNYLFEIPSGITYLEALNQLCAITSNAQWHVNASGVISIAKTLGTDRSSTILLTIPNSTSSSRQFRRPDLRTFMFASNGFKVESQKNATQEAIFGRREGFIGHQHADGQSNADAAKQALDSVSAALDEYTFQYIETDTTRAWIDFVPGDTVKIEYEAGVTQDRQIVGLGLALTPEEVRTEVIIGDIIDGVLRRIQKKEGTGQYSDQIELIDFKAGRIPDPPNTITSTIKEGGPFNAGVLVGWTEPDGWENAVSHYEVEVYPTGKRADGSTNYRGKDTSGSDVTYNDDPVRIKTAGTNVLVNGLGRPDGQYKAKVRTVNHDQRESAWSSESTFNLSSFNVTIVSGHIASANYNPGSAGWVIKADGSVEFENGTFRGTIDASKAHIGEFNADRIPNLNASKITAGTIDASTVTITNLDADNITTGSLSASSVSGGTLNTAIGVTASTVTFRGDTTTDGTHQVEFNQSDYNGASAMLFGKTTSNAAYGKIVYGDALTGGSGEPSNSGISLRSGSGSGYVTVTETGSENVYIHADDILTLSTGSTEASQYVKVDHALEVNGTLRAKDNCNVGPAYSGFSKSAEQYLQVTHPTTAGIVIGSASDGYFRFGDAADNSVGGFWYNHFYNLMTVKAGGSNVAHFLSGGFHPQTTNTKDLGRTSYYWDDVYANGTINFSDVNAKKDIENATLGLDFIKALRPVQYKWKETKGRTGARTHNGFIAQEVKTVLGASASDTALWCSATDDEDTRLNPDTGEIEDNPNHGVTTESIRYTELIGPIVKAIQEMETRLSALE